MTIFILLLLGVLAGYFSVALIYSFYSPKLNEVRGIKFFGKIFTFISNIEGKKISKIDLPQQGINKYDLIDGQEKSNIFGLSINVFFFLWPFFGDHWYEFTYLKLKRKGEETVGDIIAWDNSDTKNIIVSRSSRSNHLLYRANYPMISEEFDTIDGGRVVILTDNLIELENPNLAFQIDNWMQFTLSILNGAIRGVVSALTLEQVNQLSTAGTASFNDTVVALVNGKSSSLSQPKFKLGNIGFKLIRTVFKDFQPVGERTEKMLDAISRETLAKKEALANIAKAEGEAKVISINATAEAGAYETKQKAIVLWQKKMLVDTGLAKTDGNGNIIELLPDANTRAWSDAMKELSKITGTLVMDSGAISKFLNIKN